MTDEALIAAIEQELSRLLRIRALLQPEDPRTKRTVSPATRKRMQEAQRRRWAKV